MRTITTQRHTGNEILISGIAWTEKATVEKDKQGKNSKTIHDRKYVDSVGLDYPKVLIRNVQETLILSYAVIWAN